MKQDFASGIFAGVQRSLDDRRLIAQEAYDAYEFDAKVIAPPSSGFFFSIHNERPVMARKIHVVPEDGGPVKTAFFCVGFADQSLRVTEAFAFTGKNDYFGHLPAEFIDDQEDDISSRPLM
jgi:hypothetical protein